MISLRHLKLTNPRSWKTHSTRRDRLFFGLIGGGSNSERESFFQTIKGVPVCLASSMTLRAACLKGASASLVNERSAVFFIGMLRLLFDSLESLLLDDRE